MFKFAQCLLLSLLITGCTHNPFRPLATVPEKMMPFPKIENVGVALVLSGGGSRGIAQAGAISVLEENGISIDLIVGSSAGAAIGALYADSASASAVRAVCSKMSRRAIMDFSLLGLIYSIFHQPTTPIKGSAYERFMATHLKAKNFSELKIPLLVVTADMVAGEKFVIGSGPIAPALRASAAIPPVISPVRMYGRTLFDGGIVEPVPVETARSYSPKVVIAIDINGFPKKNMPSNVIGVLNKAFAIIYYQLVRSNLSRADIRIISDVEGHGIFEDHRQEELFELGRKAALKMLPEIKLKLQAAGIKTLPKAGA